MAVVVTGSTGLVGSEAVRLFCDEGRDVIGLDNDMRRTFFGDEASTAWNRARLENSHPRRYRHESVDIRDQADVDRIFREHQVDLVIHAAAQPSHDWAVRQPRTDFTVNANGTLALLEATRRFAPEAPFLFVSTNKVYGDTPNRLPLVERDTRWEVAEDHPFHRGIDETMGIDRCLHSLFGVSKLAADLMVQEYGRYFEMKTMVFRCGCITGAAHSGAELHGFLAYLVRCNLTGGRYRIFGYDGKQVRDNIHARDLSSAFLHASRNPRSGEVYNMGGGRHANISLMEAIRKIEKITQVTTETEYTAKNRTGDHIWYVSDVGRFQQHFPEWRYTFDMDAMLHEMVEGIGSRLACSSVAS